MTLKKEIIAYLESLAPRQLQEDYDNSGWQCGNPESEAKGVLLCLDVTEKVVEEAISTKCNLIISHHPVIFKGIKKLTGTDFVERILLKAIKNDISIYSIHTNLDAVHTGVNAKISEKLRLKNSKILAEKEKLLQKLAVFCPNEQAEKVRVAMCEAGAGNIGNYSDCSFNTEGTGTFKGNADSDPFVGKKGELQSEKEVRIEVILPEYLTSKVISAMIGAHPYEEVAFDIFPLKNAFPMAGSGMMGELEKEMDEQDFLKYVKEKMHTKMIRHTTFLNRKIKKVAVCGGSGRFLLERAKALGADVLITSDFKYHDFFDADGKILVLDIGHFESEQFTMSLLSDWITKKFNTFAVRITEINTNPVNYY
jgi:dinuclear metal center YbgI/SA1388 family protein